MPKVTPDMYEQLDPAILKHLLLKRLVVHIHDSLANAGETFAAYYGYDSIAFHPLIGFTSGDGLIACDFLLDCPICGPGSGKIKLVVAVIDPHDMTYQIVSAETMGLGYYLNPWVTFSPNWNGEEESDE